MLSSMSAAAMASFEYRRKSTRNDVTSYFLWAFLPSAMTCVCRCRLSSSSFVRPSQSKAVVYLENILTYNHSILHGHPRRAAPHSHRKGRHYLLPVRSYRKEPSKMPPPTAVALGWVSSRFALPHQLVGLDSTCFESQKLLELATSIFATN